MTRITTHDTIDAAPEAARPLLEDVRRQLGSVPNLFRVVASSPAALRAYTGFSAALAGGALAAPTRERIALAVAQVNGCGYCLAAHTYLGKNVAKLDDAEITANRHGASNDPKADAAVRFAVAITRARGRATDADVAAVQAAGYSDGEIVEIIAHVALNTLTNYVNEVAQTVVDFPAVTVGKAG